MRCVCKINVCVKFHVRAKSNDYEVRCKCTNILWKSFLNCTVSILISFTFICAKYLRKRNVMIFKVKERVMVRFLNRPQHFPLSSSDVGRSGCYRHVSKWRFCWSQQQYRWGSNLLRMMLCRRVKVSDISKSPINTVSHPSWPEWDSSVRISNLIIKWILYQANTDRCTRISLTLWPWKWTFKQ